jgi:ferredoxin
MTVESSDVARPTNRVVFDLDGLRRLFDEIASRGYEIVGPTVADGVIGLGPLESIDDLPTGWTDDQGPGRYRLRRRDDDARFGFAVGPASPKRELHPPRVPVWTMRRSPSGDLEVTAAEPETARRAFFGVRPCEVAAISVQDHVLDREADPDPDYHARRENTLLIVVNCGDPADTCFCSSMATGPFVEAKTEHDIELTELMPSDGVRYVATTGSDLGAEILAAVPAEPAGPSDEASVIEVRRRSEERIVRRLENDGLRELLYAQLENGYWNDIGDRCLSCGNCTLVCPTCFCTNPEDVTDLTNSISERVQVWDNCFSSTFSQLGASPVRQSTSSRYRQWATHKLASWMDQFGEVGCVGCGRCITWCPVGIDLTDAVAQLRLRSVNQ